MRTVSLFVALLALVAPSLGASGTIDSQGTSEPAGGAVSYLVTFSDDAPVEALLARHGVEVVHRYASFSVVHGRAPQPAWDALAGEPGVLGIEPDEPVTFHMDTARNATRVAQVHAGIPTAAGLPTQFTGAGVGIAIVDSGVDSTHPDLASRVVPGRNLRWTTEPDPSAPAFVSAPDTDLHNGHGTHVAGIAVGDGTASGGDIMGVAPGARLYAYTAGAAKMHLTDGVLASWDHIISFPQEPGEPRIQVVSNSLGSLGAPTPAITAGLRALVAADMTVVFSAGNDGDGGAGFDGVNRYCKVEDVNGDPLAGIVCVANYSDGGVGSSEGGLQDQSSRGKQTLPSTWPDVAAPGTYIQSAQAKTGVLNAPPYSWNHGKTQHPWYVTKSGTSMAAPHVAGVVALMEEAAAANGTDLSPAQVEAALKETAHPFANYAPYPNRHAGYGLVDARAAVEHALNLTQSPMDPGLAKNVNRMTIRFISAAHLFLTYPTPSDPTGAADLVWDWYGVDKPLPRVDYILPGSRLVMFDAILDQVGDAGPDYGPGKLCYTLEFLGSGKTISECVPAAWRTYGTLWDYRSGIDGDVRVTATYDQDGDGVFDAHTDLSQVHLYRYAIPDLP